MTSSSEINPLLPVQTVNISNDDLKLRTPCGLLCAGVSNSGKSFFLFNLVKFRNVMFDKPFERIILCEPSESHNSELFKMIQQEYPAIEHWTGLPSLKKLNLDLNRTSAKLLLVDDLMMPLLDSSEMLKFVTQYNHMYNISTCLNVQNYFFPARSKFGKTLIKNCCYRVFFYNPLEQRELSMISSQIANSPKFLPESFEFLKSTYPKDPSHYILIDGHLRNKNHSFFCRSHIFPNEFNKIQPIIFLKKS